MKALFKTRCGCSKEEDIGEYYHPPAYIKVLLISNDLSESVHVPRAADERIFEWRWKWHDEHTPIYEEVWR